MKPSHRLRGACPPTHPSPGRRSRANPGLSAATPPALVLGPGDWQLGSPAGPASWRQLLRNSGGGRRGDEAGQPYGSSFPVLVWRWRRLHRSRTLHRVAL